MEQLNLFDQQIQTTQKDVVWKDEPYRNGLGELLPWEEPEYIKTNKNGNIGLV